ncbi:group II intron maturase-specific domain-containing protein [Herbivorax sp. ANBcel31]|uniref:group II intron maturase-specific domain-containing protein n=1 Tax=Herbivorax sp. ANBcel31 TaxID=3069754 RepID=UPI0027B61165|nr:group II intron maturase-specific domain-containing protein [Herbivorax sp. ANBcel31]MDQ2086330.1 group II intron maturase-specific domain-containing protein [Herbivorax sp. ANBcel31]
MKLTVNQKKTSITSVHEGVAFLGFIIREKNLCINPKRVERFKDKVRIITKRNSGREIEKVIEELNPVIRGWINYYRAANCKVIIR